ncbi:MAG: ABC transporter substrate-binding protein [Gammaproteobacteria bacterium]|nr:ABC transporter substrate-binding protein [Gammaproteobacteria bacterium]
MLCFVALLSCNNQEKQSIPTLHWYVFNERSGAFKSAAQHCTQASQQAYKIEFVPLPADADQQREQLVRRLAAKDSAIDIIGMDVIWTAEFARAGWILPWKDDQAKRARAGRLQAPLQSASFQNQLWAIPFTTNTQLLWYRTDRVKHPPTTWDEMLRQAEALGELGKIQAQGERYEGFTVFFISLLASAGTSVLDASNKNIALDKDETIKALTIMSRFANSSAADPALATSRENQARLAFEKGDSSFMLNYTFVWPSANANAPQIAKHMGWARWPAVVKGQASRVTIGGINLGISAHSRYPALAFQAATCLASENNQRIASSVGGMPPTIVALYDDPDVRKTFPFADTLRATLRDSVQRPQTPLYNDVSLAISRTLHPMRNIKPERDYQRLHKALQRALNSEGLL